MEIYKFDEFILKIEEGLINTIDVDKTLSNISRLIDEYDIEYSIEKLNNNTLKLNLNNFNKIVDLKLKLESILDTLFNLYGWFPSYQEMENFYGMKKKIKFRKGDLLMPKNNLINVSITFESKFDLIEKDIPIKLYHLSIQNYKKDILKYGLVPKSKSKLSSHDYDGRVYLTKNINHIKTLIPKMKLFYSMEKADIINNINNPKGKYKKDTNWIIFEIDTKLANIKKLYTDPNFINGYYYLENIPNNAIKIIEEEF